MDDPASTTADTLELFHLNRTAIGAPLAGLLLRMSHSDALLINEKRNRRVYELGIQDEAILPRIERLRL
jgi:hypothetical protein